MNLAEYFLAAGRGSKMALAKGIGAHPPDVSRWSSGERRVPLEWCNPIERYTKGVVTRQELRPDDWHLIWPELVAVHASSIAGIDLSSQPDFSANQGVAV